MRRAVVIAGGIAVVVVAVAGVIVRHGDGAPDRRAAASQHASSAAVDRCRALASQPSTEVDPKTLTDCAALLNDSRAGAAALMLSTCVASVRPPPVTVHVSPPARVSLKYSTTELEPAAMGSEVTEVRHAASE